AVGEPSCWDERSREDDRISVQDPRQLGKGCIREGRPDVREGDVDDRHVEEAHEHPDRRHQEHLPTTRQEGEMHRGQHSSSGITRAMDSFRHEKPSRPRGSPVESGHPGVMSYDATIYQGAAAHYRLGRPAYSPQLEALLARELNLDGRGRLLDGGCGPGILTVRLAHLFEEAIGLDPDPAMLAGGRRAAHEHRIANIRWVQARADDLPEAAPGLYRLV